MTRHRYSADSLLHRTSLFSVLADPIKSHIAYQGMNAFHHAHTQYFLSFFATCDSHSFTMIVKVSRESPADQKNRFKKIYMRSENSRKKYERNMSEANCSNIIDAMWCFAAPTFAHSDQFRI